MITALVKRYWLHLSVLALIVVLSTCVDFCRNNAITYKDLRDKASDELNLANATITDMQVCQRDVTALDEKYTKELADAKRQLDDLQRCVSSGKCGLRLNANYPANGTASASGMDDAASAGLTDAAERDYFTLRERIETSGKMISGLQDYIRQQCLK